MRRRKFQRAVTGGWIACLLALIAAAFFASPAQAAPKYKDSEPGAGSSVQTPPGIVSITFSEPIDESSTMSVANACGAKVDGGHVDVNFDTMRVSLDERHYSGTYTVSYTATGLAGVTGTTRGSFAFQSAEGHSCEDHGNKKKKHDDHKDGDNDRHGDHDDKKAGHDDHDDGTDGEHNDHTAVGENNDHSGGMSSHTNHSSMTNSSGHNSHESASGSHGNQGHGKNHGGGNGNEHSGHGNPEGEFASGPLPSIPADAQAVLIALALCAGMGIVGGVFLRTAAD